MRTEEALVTPEVLRWARERARINHAKLAKKISSKTTPELVAEWEHGAKKPTRAQAEKLARALYVPFGYLFLPSPPQDSLPIADFRSIGTSPAISGDLIDLIDSALFKQDWYREYLLDEGAEPLSFVGRYRNQTQDRGAVASDISKTLGIDDRLRSQCSTAEEFLYRIVQRAEKSGILVMRNQFVDGNRNRRVEVDQFRGFAISDPIAPLIFINSGDAKAAQIFTMGHELAHIWIGATGISNESVDALIKTSNSTEIFCNSVSAELLVPSSELRKLWMTRAPVAENLNMIRFRFRVSYLVALRRAFELGNLARDVYHNLYSAEVDRLRQIGQRNRPKKTGGNAIKTLLSRNSRTFTRTLIAAARQGNVAYRDAAAMLNLKVSTVQKLAESM